MLLALLVGCLMLSPLTQAAESPDDAMLGDGAPSRIEAVEPMDDVPTDDEPGVVHATTMIGVGGTSVLDTYLSPSTYANVSYSLMSQQSWRASRSGAALSHLSTWWLHLAPSMRASHNGVLHYLEMQYSYALHYRQPVTPSCTWLIGGGVSPTLGAIYNPRNGNNPVNALASINAQLSTGAVWQLASRRFPLRISAYVEVPLVGLLFSPEYGQSYYEMSLHGVGETLHLGSLHNQWAVAPQLSIEIPLGDVAMALGYRGHYYAMAINGLVSQRYASAVMIGLSGDFMRFRTHRSSPASPDSY